MPGSKDDESLPGSISPVCLMSFPAGGFFEQVSGKLPAVFVFWTTGAGGRRGVWLGPWSVVLAWAELDRGSVVLADTGLGSVVVGLLEPLEER
jgi:hypothetical protein